MVEKLKCQSVSVGLLIALSLMTVGAVLAQVPMEKEQQTAKGPNPAERPTLDQLIEAFARHERNYLPYHVKALETFRMNDGLSVRERLRYPWADGHKKQNLMEYGQYRVGVWLRKETSLRDGKVQSHFDQYDDESRLIKVSRRPGSDEGLRIHLEYGHRQKLVSLTPFEGIFPLSSYSDSLLFSEAIASKRTKVSLQWDDEDAVLEFQFGSVAKPMRYLLWLSRAHDWHPVKLQRFQTVTSKQFFSEWKANRLSREDDKWRVKEGTRSWREREEAEKEDAKVMYSVDCVVLESEFGETVTRDRFTYDIPPDAEVHDPRNPRPKEPIGQTREVVITVVDMARQPIRGATVRLRTLDGRDLDQVETNDNGVARSDKAPSRVSIEVTALNHREANCVLLPSSSEIRVLLAPTTTGTVKDESAAPLANVWITSKAFWFRADGLVSIPYRRYAESRHDWSDDAGRFTLDSELTLRSREQPVLLAAVDDSISNMTFTFVSASDLREPQELVLKATCEVKGVCVFEGVSQPSRIGATVEDELGRRFASVDSLTRSEGETTRAAFRLRLPEGQYRLKSRDSAFHPSFSVPLSIKKGQQELDFGAVSVAAGGLFSLKGKPAPELMVTWRPGEESSLAKMRGHVVVLDFWGFWCGPCVRDMLKLMDTAERFKNRPVKWLAVHNPSLSTFAEMDEQTAHLTRQSWNGRKMTLQTVIDRPSAIGDQVGITARRFGVSAWPTLVVIDHDGKVVGAVSKETLAGKIDELLSDRP